MSTGYAVPPGLSSKDIAEQVACLKEFLSNLGESEIAEAQKQVLINCLASSDYPEFVAEQLVKVAPRLVNELQALLHSDAPWNARFWTAMLLLAVDIYTGVPLLLETVRQHRRDTWYVLAANKLVHANQRAVIEYVLQALAALSASPEAMSVHDAYEIAALLNILELADEPAPEGILKKLSTADLSAQHRLALGFGFNRLNSL